MKLLEGKVAVVTGAARGIGKAIALQFAKEGANVAFTDLAIDENGKATEAEIAALGVKCKGYASNAADFEQTHEVVKRIVEEFGRIDILVNNAGIAHIGLLTDLDNPQWDRIIRTNLSSVFYCCRAAVPGMVARKQGAIINISSMWGTSGASCEVAYSATKGGINAFTKALAKEAGPHGIRVNAVAPGFIVTDMTLENKPAFDSYRAASPIGMLGEPEYIAEAVSYVVGAEFMTGQIISPNGGLVI